MVESVTAYDMVNFIIVISTGYDSNIDFTKMHVIKAQ